MKILHIANEVVDTGNGICNSSVDLACHQSMLGHSVCFVSSGGAYAELLRRYNVSHFEVEQRARNIAKLFGDLPRLRQMLWKMRPDIVHAHMMTGAVLMRLGRALAGFGDYGLVTTVHNEWRASSHLMRAGDGIIVLSESGKQKFRKRGFPAHKMHVVRHGVLNSPRNSRDAHLEAVSPSLTDVPCAIVTVAGLYRRKGIGDLICAFGQIAEEFPEACLLVAGWGPDQGLFERQRRSTKGGDRIHFLGFVREGRSLLSRSAIFVLASHTESFPLAIAEAREAGCAIIATAVGGVPELLERGRAGLLIPPRNPQALAQALRRLLGDRQELARWRQAAQANIRWLTCERMATETLEVYSSLLAHKAARRC